MQKGGTFQGNSYSLVDDEEARKEALELAKRAKERREAGKSNRFRDDDYNPLGGNESGPRYRNNADCGPKGG